MTPERLAEIRAKHERFTTLHREDVADLLAALDAVTAERDAKSDEILHWRNEATRLEDVERRRWYASLSLAFSVQLDVLSGLAPEVACDRIAAHTAAYLTAVEQDGDPAAGGAAIPAERVPRGGDGLLS